MSAAATQSATPATPEVKGRPESFGTQAPVQPKHDKALTGRQVAIKLNVSTGTVRRARRTLELTNSGTGYSPTEVKAIEKLLKQQASKSGGTLGAKTEAKPAKSASKTASAAAAKSESKPQG